jgi:hypothetical protein
MAPFWGLTVAVIGQLQQDGHVVLTGDARNPYLKAVEGVTPADPLCESFHRHIAFSRKPRKLGYWRRRFQIRTDVLRRTADRLVERGILEKRQVSRAGSIKQWAYPELDPRPETELHERIHAWAADPGGTLDPALEALLSIAHTTGVLRAALGFRFVADHVVELNALRSDHPLARLVTATQQEAQVAAAFGIVSGLLPVVIQWFA